MKNRRTVQLFLIILTLAFIWGHSVVPTELSAQESEGFSEGIVAPVLRFFLGRFVTVDNNLVRKFAHATEFFILGIQVFFYVITDGSFCVFKKDESKENKHKDTYLIITVSLLLCLIAAAIDETIQVFSGRGPLLKDVLIDGIGAAIGITAGFFAVCIYFIRQRKNEVENKR